MADAPGKPGTGCGSYATVYSPLPSWPRLPSPQHTRSPFWRRAHAWPLPAARAVVPSAPGTSAGVISVSPMPLPPWPCSAAAPAMNRAVGKERARELAAGDDRHRGRDAGDIDGREGVEAGAVARGAVVVLSPTPHRTGVEEGAGVAVARGDAHRAGEARDLGRHRRRLEAAGAERAAGVLAPTAAGPVGEDGARVALTASHRADLRLQGDDGLAGVRGDVSAIGRRRGRDAFPGVDRRG